MTSAESAAVFAGRRVLVVEDETVVAMLLEDMLEDLGCRLAESLGSLQAALEAAETTDAEVAVLDVNVGGESVFPVAERLEARGVPLIFATGYGPAGLPERWRGSAVLGKPFLQDDLKQALGRALARPGRSVPADGPAGA